MILQRERNLAKYSEKMDMLFSEADVSGDGFLSQQEFKDVMKEPRVKAWLQAMELDVTVADIDLVFKLMDDGDRRISAEELVQGFSQLKGPAKSLDMLKVQKSVRHTEKILRRVCAHMQIPLTSHPSGPGTGNKGSV